MKKEWPRVRLGEVLHRTSAAVSVRADVEYPNFGVYSFGRGLFRKPPISGALTSASMLYKAKAGQFVYSRLFAFEGAYGFVSPEFDGYYVSNEFPLFDCNLDRVVPEFIAGYVRQPHIWRSIAESATGVGHRRQRVQPGGLLAYELPLPPLAEQQRVVKRIGALFAGIDEARTVRQDAAETARALLAAARRILIGDTPRHDWIAMSRMVSEIENGKSPRCESRPAHSNEWGVLKVGAVSFGAFNEHENKALPSGHPFDGRYEVRAGDFLMSRANTTELVGACTIVGPTRSKLLLSDKIFRFRFRRGTGTAPVWVEHVMKSPALREQIQRGATGTSPTMKNISKEKVLNLLLPPHSPSDQHRIVAELETLQKEVEALRSLQIRTSAELNALLPAILHHAFRRDF